MAPLIFQNNVCFRRKVFGAQNFEWRARPEHPNHQLSTTIHRMCPPCFFDSGRKNVECVADCLIGRIEKVYGDGFWSLGAHEASHVLPWLQLVRNGAGVGKLSVLQDIFQIAAVSWLLGNAIDGLSGCAFAGVRFFDASGRCGEGLQALWQRCLADWGCGGTPSCHPSPSDSFFWGGLVMGKRWKMTWSWGTGTWSLRNIETSTCRMIWDAARVWKRDRVNH